MPFLLKGQTDSTVTFRVEKEQIYSGFLKIIPDYKYPQIAIDNGYEGTIEVCYIVNENRTLSNVYVKNKGKFHQSLEEAAIEAIKNAVFMGDVPYNIELCTKVVYKLR